MIRSVSKNANNYAPVAQDLNKTLGLNESRLKLKTSILTCVKIEPMMHIVDLAKEAMKAAGITPIIKLIRGGTDGSHLIYGSLVPIYLPGGIIFTAAMNTFL